MRRGPVPGLRVLLPRHGRIVVGRDGECDLPVDDSRSSRRQCSIEVDTTAETVTLTDLGSSNGTYVNRTKVDKSDLKPGDRIYFGRCVFELQRIRVTEQIRIQPSDGRPVDPGADTQVLKGGAAAPPPDTSDTPTEEGEIPDFARLEAEGTTKGKRETTSKKRKGRRKGESGEPPTPEEIAERSSDEFDVETLDVDLEGSGRFHVANLVQSHGEPMKTETLEPIDAKEWHKRPSGRLVRVGKQEKLAPSEPTERHHATLPALQSSASHHGTAPPPPKKSVDGAPQQGDLVGPYRLLEPLGEGFTGPVFRCAHTVMNTNHAIKLLTPERAQNKATAYRFQWEAEISGLLDHPNIRRLTNAGQDGNLSYLVFDFVEGADLGRIVHGGAPLPVDSALFLGIKGCDALAHVHAKGVIHRAVTPTSVLVTEDGNIRLCDFNLAQRVKKPATMELLDDAINAFDLSFRAPELLASKPRATEASDVYGLCATLYFALTGATPFDASNPDALPEAIRTAEPVSPSELNPEVPAGLNAVLTRGLETSPKERYESAQELRAALAELLGASHST